MTAAVIGILTVMTFAKWPALPNLYYVMGFFLLLLFLRFVADKRHHTLLLMGLSFLFAVILCVGSVTLYLHKTQVAQNTTKNTLISGEVETLFITASKQTRILFSVTALNGRKLSHFDKFYTQLYWKSVESVKQGQHWQLTARLREPYGRANEAGFAAERYYLSKHIHSKGSVLSAQLIENELSLRQRFFDWLYPQIQPYPHAAYLIALSVGERALLTDQDWRLLQSSGLAHLVAISGLHVGLAYLFGAGLCLFLRPVFSRSPKMLYVPLLVGLGFAFCYSWLAGFSLPTQRALLALSVFTAIRLAGFSINAFSLLTLVAAIVLIWDPFAVFSSGFWLSFSAVLVLVIMSALVDIPPRETWREKITHYLKALLLTQLFLTLGMLPVMALSFSGMSATAVLFNVFALPWVSMIVLPLILVSLLLSLFGYSGGWQLADAALTPLISALPLSEGHWISLQHVDFLWLCLVALSGLLLWFKVWRMPALFISLVLLLVSWRDAPTTKGNWQIDVLDVGHGLAALLSQGREAILYDTGTRWQQGSIAQAVIDPILQQRQLTLHGVILSHADRDHAGGITWLQAHYPDIWVRAVNADNAYLPCQRGEVWQWQALTFEVVFPDAPVDKPKNADSCVVRVTDGQRSVLLTGDLPKKQERLLVARGARIDSDILLVPHHGSKTSSSLPFLHAVSPSVAIVSTGRYTPWNLPDIAVVARYRDADIAWYNTAKQGQVKVSFSEQGINVASMREDIAAFWHSKIFGEHLIKE